MAGSSEKASSPAPQPDSTALTGHPSRHPLVSVAGDLCRHGPVVGASERNRDIHAMFEADPDLVSIPVVDDGSLIGLIHRHEFLQHISGSLRWEVYAKKRCTRLMDHEPLVVAPETPIPILARGLLDVEHPHRLSAGFVIARDGELRGTGLTSDVLAAMLLLERDAAAALKAHHDQLAELVESRTRDLLASRQAAERHRIEDGLAKEIMEQMLQRRGLEDPQIAHWLLPAENFSGDVIAAARSPDNDLYVFQADATGHGLGPAITLVPVITLFYRLVALGCPLPTLVGELNRELLETMPPSRFVAAAFIALSATSRTAWLWQGGMPAVLHLNRKRRVRQRYPAMQVPLGIVPLGEEDLTCQRIALETGDQLVLFSDGLIEADTGHSEPFGEARLAASLRRLGTGRQIDAVRAALAQHLGRQLPHDDISLVLIDA